MPIRPPKYRHFKPKNLAVVRLNGHDVYLGRYSSPESWEKYHRLLAENAAGQQASSSAGSLQRANRDLTINEMVHAYRLFAEAHYSVAGKPTKEFVEMKYAARPLRKLFGSTLAKDFGPLSLKSVRQHMVDQEKLSRRVTNHRVNRIKRIFKWAVSEELVPSHVLEGLRSVNGLLQGRTTAHETEPVRPVAWEHVTPVLPLVSSPVATMIQVQYLTAMRPCEVVQLRAEDIDRSSRVWVLELARHKNEWRGLKRQIPLGPKVQELLKPYLERHPQGFLFSPMDAELERNRRRRQERKTPITPSQAKRRRKRSPLRAKRDHYDVDAYRRAIEYGIARVNRSLSKEDQIPRWYPLQIRHARATEIRKQYGLEAAQVALGHARADVTQVYAERNLSAAIKMAAEIG